MAVVGISQLPPFFLGDWQKLDKLLIDSERKVALAAVSNRLGEWCEFLLNGICRSSRGNRGK